MSISATWRDSASLDPAAIEARAVAALAASLVIPALSPDAAAAFAEAEGLVTHLTSLVLIDEAGEVQQSVPAMRKVALPSPRTHGLAASRMRAMAPAPAFHEQHAVDSVGAAAPPPRGASAKPRMLIEKVRRRFAPDRGRVELSDEHLLQVARQIDWDQAPQQLQSGDLSALAAKGARAIRNAAAEAEVAALAATLGLDPTVLVIGLLAYAARGHRTAARIARAIFGGEPPAAALALAQQLQLSSEAA
jgi:hypothetical protein